MDKKNFTVYIAMIIAMFFWGISFIWTKIVFEAYPPITTVFLRLVLSSILLLGIGVLTKRLQKLQKKDLKTIVLLTFYQPFLYFLGENFGLKEVSSTVTSVLISMIPLFSPIAAAMFLKERFSGMNVLGIVVSVVGVLLVVMKDDFSLAASPKGIMYLLLAILSAVAYSVVVVKMTGRYNVYSLIAYQNSIGVLMFLPLFLFFDLDIFIAAQPTARVLGSLVALAVFASTVAFIFFTYGIQNLGITKANSLTNIIPVFTAIFAWWILGEVLSTLNMFGILIVVVGLFVSQIKFKPKLNLVRFRR